MSFKTLNELFSLRYPPVKEHVSMSILREQNRLCVFGGPKLGKSLLVSQLGLCLAAGEPWLGFNTIPTKVMSLQSELVERDYRDRLIAMAGNAAIAITSDQFLSDTDTTFKLDLPGNTAWLEGQLRRFRPEVLILDPWYKMLTVEDNKAYDRSKDIMDKLIKDYKIAIIMVHHDTVPERNPQTGVLETKFHPRGSRTVEGWFDSIIQIDGDIDTDERTLRFEMRHPTKLLRPHPIALNRQRVWWEYNP